MSIFNFFSKKKKEGKTILSMVMFKGDKAYSFDSVKQDLRTYWSLDVNDGDGDDEAAVFSVNGKRVVLASMPHPIPEGELDSLYDYNYLLKDAGKEIKEHTQHAIVSVMPTDSSIVEQYILLTKVIASILRTSQNAIGVYHGDSSLLLPKDFYLDESKGLFEDTLPVSLWVYIGIVKDGEKSSLYTYGMSGFDKSEMEIVDSNMKMGDLYDFLLNTIHYVLDQDVTLKDGETLGYTENQKIKIKRSKAVYLEGGKTLKFEM